MHQIPFLLLLNKLLPSGWSDHVQHSIKEVAFVVKTGQQVLLLHVGIKPLEKPYLSPIHPHPCNEARLAGIQNKRKQP